LFLCFEHVAFYPFLFQHNLMSMGGKELQNILADNIRNVRKEMGFSQAELAERVGISSGYMCDLERSKRWPSAKIIVQLAAVLKLEPFQLFLPSDSSPYFEKHKVLTSFTNELKKSFGEIVENLYDDMLREKTE